MPKFHCSVTVGPFHGVFVNTKDAPEAERLYRETLSVGPEFEVMVTPVIEPPAKPKAKPNGNAS